MVDSGDVFFGIELQDAEDEVIYCSCNMYVYFVVGQEL